MKPVDLSDIRLILDIPGHAVPTWQDVIERDYHRWDDRPRLIIDSAVTTIPEAANRIRQALG